MSRKNDQISEKIRKGQCLEGKKRMAWESREGQSGKQVVH